MTIRTVRIALNNPPMYEKVSSIFLKDLWINIERDDLRI